MAIRMFQALPSYLGGKRRLLGEIFREVPPVEDAPIFVDAFLGGGSVSLYAKARGYRVIANDIADRSIIVGRALIENDRVTLSRDDVTRLFHRDGNDGPGFVERTFSPDTFARRHARFIDTALANARKLGGSKRWLSTLLIVKYALRIRPMGNFGAKRIIHQVEAGEWEEMNPNYVKDVFARGMPGHPMRIAESLRKSINRGVFANGQVNECRQLDVMEFLRGVEGDVVYFDPPYSATQSYERSSKPLDDLLRGEARPAESNPFSTESPEKMLPRLFEAAEHIPTWIVSFGNKVIGLGDLMDIVRRYRPKVTGREIKHAYCTGLASAESRKRNRELLVVGRNV